MYQENAPKAMAACMHWHATIPSQLGVPIKAATAMNLFS